MEPTENQNSPVTPSPSPSATKPRARKSLSPLAVVLMLSASFFVIFMVVSGALFLYRSPGTTPAGKIFGGGAVGVVEIEGVILDSKQTLEQIEAFDSSGEIRAIVLRLNSPGGAVAPSQEIYEAVRRVKKPVVVSMASVAASGAYYIACGAKKVFANPGTITGSIGVIMEFANLEKLYEWAKIRRYTIKTGKFKDVGAEYKEMDAEDRALLQGMINDVLLQFKEAVATGRNLSEEQLGKVSDGRIMSGNQAKQAGLVDEIGTLDDAIREAGILGGIKGKPRVAYPRPKRPRLLQLLLEDGIHEGGSSRTSERSAGWIAGVLRDLIGAGARPAVLPPGIYWLWSEAR